jgi:retinoblastoma-like protein 1
MHRLHFDMTLFSLPKKGDVRHWICCAVFTACTKQKVPTVNMSDTFVQGNGISLVKLINECNLK